MKKPIYITTTADLNTEADFQEHLEKFPKYFRDDTIEIRGSFRVRICNYNEVKQKWEIKVKEATK